MDRRAGSGTFRTLSWQAHHWVGCERTGKDWEQPQVCSSAEGGKYKLWLILCTGWLLGSHADLPGSLGEEMQGQG